MKLLAMSGLVPEQVCDIMRFTGYAGERTAAHYCGYASDFISMVRQDRSLDGAVFPRSCDSSRILKNYLSENGKFFYQLSVPARQDGAAVDYFAEELRNYRKAVERYFHTTITDAQVCARAEAVNARNRELRKIYDCLEDVSYGQYLRAVHGMLRTPLSEQKVQDCDCSDRRLDGADGQDGTGIRDAACGRHSGTKRVFLIGSTLCNERIADHIEACGMKVVGDDLPESGRLCMQPEVETGDDVYHGIATSFLTGRLSPTQDNFGRILEKDLAEMKKKAVRGVLFVTQKYCEPYDYLFYVYKKMLDAEGIPVVKIAMADSLDDKKISLAVEAFSDMI